MVGLDWTGEMPARIKQVFHSMTPFTGNDRALYDSNWLVRGTAVKAGIFANSAIEAMYPQARVTANGKILHAGKHNDTLTFAKGSLPLVNAFRSVTMDDGKTQFLINNPLNRYLMNSLLLNGVKASPDGSPTLYVRKDSPGKRSPVGYRRQTA